MVKTAICAHDYDQAWRCKLCGYKLPKGLQRRVLEINQIRSEFWRPDVTITETVGRYAKR